MFRLRALPTYLIALLIMLLSSSASTSPLQQASTTPGEPGYAPGSIISLQTLRPVSFTELMQQLRASDYILLGETHDKPMHHALQHKILHHLFSSGQRPAVVFEMFDQEDRAKITQTQQQYPNEPDRIAQAVDWDNSGWPAWHMYRPLVATSLQAQLPIVAGNLSREQAMDIVLGGLQNTVMGKDIDNLGLKTPLGQAQEAELLDRLVIFHREVLPEAILQNMLLAQRARDATLADAMISHNQGNGAVLIAGSGHARIDYGVPFYLRQRQPQQKVASLAFAPSLEALGATNKNTQNRAYDFVWLLPENTPASLQTAHK